MKIELISTIISIIFLVSIYIYYFDTKKEKNIINTLYKIIVFNTILILINSILNSYININILYIPYNLFKIFYSLLILLLLKEIIKKNISLKDINILLTIIVISLIILIFGVNNNKLITIYELIFNIAILIIQIYLFIKNINKINKENKILIIIIILTQLLPIIINNSYKGIVQIICFLYNAYILCFLANNPQLNKTSEIKKEIKIIEKSNKIKGNLLTNMTYEIKNPLSIISNTCDELIHQENYIKEESVKQIKQIINSSNKLMDILNNIINVSKIETNETYINEKKYNIKSIFDDLEETAINKIGNKNIKFITNIDENIPSILYGDNLKLYESLTNVLINAINFTEVGKITLSVTGNINDNNNIKLLFKIEDTGQGIKKEDQDNVFKKRQDLEDNNQNNIGFGLLIAKEYIESMNGKIWFTSKYKVGSTFYIELEQKIISNFPIKNERKIETEDNDIIDCSNYKVLLVDDNKPNLKVNKRLLQKYKLKVDEASSGKECIYKVKNDEKYDLIFLDHIMPEIDGIETLKVLKNLKDYKLPPIICVTANQTKDMEKTYIKSGFNDIIQKPINIKDLDRIIKKYINNK